MILLEILARRTELLGKLVRVRVVPAVAEQRAGLIERLRARHRSWQAAAVRGSA